MGRRAYRLGKRGEAADATRRRIVEATMALHDRQGITGTSVRDVAVSAGVSPATVLRHFPRMGDLIEACGRLSDALFPLPTDAVLEDVADRGDAVRRVALAFFQWWGHDPTGWHHLQVDRLSLPPVEGWLRNVEAQRRALVAAALGPGAADPEISLVTALTSHGAWTSLRDAGLSADEAARQVARFCLRGAD